MNKTTRAHAAPSEPYTEWVDVSPAMAQEMLDNFARNRSSAKAVVEMYARDMLAGRWLQTGDTLKQDPDGTWWDGMQRLKAVIASGRTVRLLLARNAPIEGMPVTDAGRPRSYRDVMTIRGEANTKELAALVRRLYDWDRGLYWRVGGGYTPSKAELDAYLDDHPELRDIAKIIANSKPPLVPATAYGVCHVVFGRISPGMRDNFCNAWVSGAGLTEGSPVLALRNRLIADSGSTRYRSANTRSEYPAALACIAWNAFRRGQQVSKLQLPKGGLSNGNYPLPR